MKAIKGVAWIPHFHVTKMAQDSCGRPQGGFHSQVHGNGRCQIPAEIRRKWNIRDGDFLIWDPTNHVARVYPATLTQKRLPD